MNRMMLAAVMLVASLLQSIAGVDEDAIRQLLSGTFDKPEARLVVEPVVVASDHAIAGWRQAETGGRALLRRKGSEWSIVLCSGDALKSADMLVKAAVPKAEAAQLEERLAEAEATLDSKIVDKFSRFEGLVMMDEAGHHPPHHK